MSYDTGAHDANCSKLVEIQLLVNDRISPKSVMAMAIRAIY